MDPINSWLDPDQVRKLAERLAGNIQAPSPRDLAASGEDKQTTAQQTSMLPSERPNAPVPTGGAETSPSPGRLMFQVQKFRESIHGSHPFAGLFLLDHEGQVIFDEGDCDCVYFLARYASAPGSSTSNTVANFRVRLDPSATVEVIPVETTAGRLVLGILVTKPLSSGMIAEISQMLVTATAPVGHLR